MIGQGFDSRTLAIMTAALNCVCDGTARGDEHHARKRVARQIIKCARSGKTSLGDLVAAGRRALIGVVATGAASKPPPSEPRVRLHRP